VERLKSRTAVNGYFIPKCWRIAKLRAFAPSNLHYAISKCSSMPNQS